MSDNRDDFLSKKHTFRFNSGQVLSLNQDQIEKIPYINGLVSSADWFECARDENGNFQLDPCINYEDFIHILNSLRFHSIRQLFTTLPKKANVIPIIYLFDFLGLGPQPNPTLREVDSSFFSPVVYSPATQQQSLLFKPSVIQDLAVQFAIAIVKEEYDFSNNDVIDHVYWLIMFILSAWKYFGPCLRHHVHAIAMNCFTVFKPSQLKPLMKLRQRMNYDTKIRSIARERRTGCDPLFFFQLENVVLKFDYLEQDHDDYECVRRMLSEKDHIYAYRNRDYNVFRWPPKKTTEEDLLKPMCDYVQEIIYARLQDQICQRILSVLHNNKQRENKRKDTFESIFEKFNKNIYRTNIWKKFILLSLARYSPRFYVLPDAVGNLFKSEHLKQEIRELILKELSILTLKLKEHHVELKKKLQTLKAQQNNSNVLFGIGFFFRIRPRHAGYEFVQQETLCHTLLLDKLNGSSDIVVTQVQQLVCNSLRRAALQQLNQWLITKNEIEALRVYLTTKTHSVESCSKLSQNTYQRYRAPEPKFVPKHQLKYFRR